METHVDVSGIASLADDPDQDPAWKRHHVQGDPRPECPVTLVRKVPAGCTTKGRQGKSMHVPSRLVRWFLLLAAATAKAIPARLRQNGIHGRRASSQLANSLLLRSDSRIPQRHGLHGDVPGRTADDGPGPDAVMGRRFAPASILIRKREVCRFGVVVPATHNMCHCEWRRRSRGSAS